ICINMVPLDSMRLRKVNVQLAPGPRGLPLVGYLPFLGNNLHHEFTKLAQIYGPIYKLSLGRKFCVVISSPLLMKEVVHDQDTIFRNRDCPITGLVTSNGGIDIVLSFYGPHWRKMCKTFVYEMLSNTSLDACYELRREELKKIIRQVYKKNIGIYGYKLLTFMSQSYVLMITYLYLTKFLFVQER
ncbi:p450 domain-containing protein, partial [Cephalotus follicularis]